MTQSPGASAPAAPEERRAKRRWEAADTLVAVVVAFLVVIFAVFVALCVQAFGTTADHARTRAQAAAQVVSDEVSWMTGASLAALRLIDANLSLLPAALDATDRAELDASLRALPVRTQLSIYDATGLVVPNGGAPGLPASIADTEYFAALAAGGDWTILPQTADSANGQPLIVLAKSLGTEIFAGVALLALDGRVLEGFWQAQSQALGPEATINVVRADGWLVGRYPPVETVYNAAEASPYWEMVRSSPAGAYTARSAVDGVTRVIGFQHLPQLGLIVFATMSQDTAMAGLWSAIGILLWLLVPLSLALLGGSLLTARLLRQSRERQRTLAAALAHNEVLFREIHHRVKNNLQSVASLLQMQPIPREIKANMNQRIAAMSAVHEHIYRSNNFETVNVKGYLQTLIGSIRAGHDPQVEMIEELDEVSVDKDAATPLGLIVNEVVSNTFKHAFPDGIEGRVRVRLVRHEDNLAELTVDDNGVGFDPEQPTKGIGRRLITALTQQLGGESGFEASPDGGARFRLVFPTAAPGSGR